MIFLPSLRGPCCPFCFAHPKKVIFLMSCLRIASPSLLSCLRSFTSLSLLLARPVLCRSHSCSYNSSRLCIPTQTSRLGHIRSFSMSITLTSEHSKNSLEHEDGQVKIHSKQPKTQAELEKEKWQEVHRLACEGNRKKYIDPKTGYSVMTELLHKRRGYCCGNACRHCPYDNENVGVSPEVKKANIKRGKERRKEIEAIEGKPKWADDSSDDSYDD